MTNDPNVIWRGLLEPAIEALLAVLHTNGGEDMRHLTLLPWPERLRRVHGYLRAEIDRRANTEDTATLGERIEALKRGGFAELTGLYAVLRMIERASESLRDPPVADATEA